jgi:glucuronokinase
MHIIRQRAFARAGLVGNPSDGYFGKTISVVVRDFAAEVVLYPWDELEIVWSQEDQNRFRSIGELADDVQAHGYYGGVRLVKATIKKFHDYCMTRRIKLAAGNFSIRYQSNIPRQVGLAGSSAIIVATLRGLCEFYDVSIDRRALPSLALSVETEELGIPAGLQDRVAQVFEGATYMDFSPGVAEQVDGYSVGRYEPLDPARLPPLYVAYDRSAAEPTEIPHNDLRRRFNAGEPAVLDAMKTFASLAEKSRAAIRAGNHDELARLLDKNFDTRRAILALAEKHIRMVEAARSAGASAKFAGSGGAIIGTFTDEAMLERMRVAFAGVGLNCEIVRLKFPAMPS